MLILINDFYLNWIPQRTQVRKKTGGVALVDINERGVLNKDRPTKFLLEIANSTYHTKPFIMQKLLISFDSNLSFYYSSLKIGGSFRLYAESRGSKPLVSIFEANPLPIQYMSFSSWNVESEIQIFYNCRHINMNATAKSIMELV